jgi:glycosyltransferase involved in cell wall biosynthesis
MKASTVKASTVGARSDSTVARERRPVIAMVTDAIYPYHCGGKEVRYHELISRLSGRAELHVYTMNWWRGPRRHQGEWATFHALCRCHPLYTGNRRSIRQAAFFALACLRLLVHRFDVLEADHMPYPQIIVLWLVATIRRKRFVVTWHEVWGREYWQQYLGRAGTLAWALEWLAMRAPDHIIAASAQTADRLRVATGGRAQLTVAPNGIDLDMVRATPPAGDPVDIVVVGRLIDHKRVGMLLDAMALLHAAGRQVTCRVIGDGPDRAALHEQAAQLGIGHAVEFRHDVGEQKDLYGLMKSARVSAFPSAREGFGIAVLEAIACGLPVVTTSAPDNLARHLVARSARGIVCGESASDLADALTTLLERPADAVGGASPADAGGKAGTLRGPEELWLAEYSWDAAAASVAGALLP